MPHILDTIDPEVVGRRIGEARRASGFTQQHAAEALNLSRTTVVAMEQGTRRPRASELLALARLYGRKVGEFVRPEPASADEPDFVLQFRSARGPSDDIPERERDIDAQYFESLCRWYVELEDLLQSPLPKRYPDQYNISATPPDRAAESVAVAERNRLGIGDGPVGDLWTLLESDVGLRVFAIPMTSSRIAGMFLHSTRYGGCIAVNAKHPEEKRRWSVTHEYAHFLTDCFKPEISVLSGSRRIPVAERFADSFARFFLMPAAGLVGRFDAMRRAKNAPITPVDISTLCNLYKVSFQAMIWRLEELKLLPGGTWDKLQTYGFKPNEIRKHAGIPTLPPARSMFPRRYEMLVAQAYSRDLLSEGQLAERLATDRVAALMLMRELGQEEHTTVSGEVEQLQLDLNFALTAGG